VAKKRTYSVAEARAKLPTILNEVGDGDEVYLTRRGQTAAVVVSKKTYDALRDDRPAFDRAYAEFTARHSAEVPDLGPEDFEGLRDRTPGRKARL
jgi:prevent-host-death family protein